MNSRERRVKLHKVDTTAWTVREVEGEPWPGKDSEGDACYDNTHFVSEGAAWDKLKAEVSAGLMLADREVKQCREELRRAEEEMVRAGSALVTVLDQLDARSKKPNARGNLPP